MAGYKGFRKLKWNKSGCDPYNMGIPARLYGCDEEWRYAKCVLQRPNLRQVIANTCDGVRLIVESQRCKPDNFVVHLVNTFNGEYSGCSYPYGHEILFNGLEPGREYFAYVVGVRENDDGTQDVSCASNMVYFTMKDRPDFVFDEIICGSDGMLCPEHYLK